VVAYLTLCRGNTGGVYPLGYVPHNHHFLWFAASMEGNSAMARVAAVHTAERTSNAELMRQPGFEAMQHYWMTPWFDHVRFGRWDEIAAAPNPAPDLHYVNVIWHYAEGIAAARQGRKDDARQHLQAIRPLAADPVLLKMLVWDRYPLSHAAQIAERSLTAEVALLDKDTATAIAALQDAVKIEDGIPYDEPPGWHAPTRHALGAALLDAGKASDAEAVYRAELERNPQNGWSLIGLAQSLRAQNRSDEAAQIEKEFEQAWKNADVKLVASRI
jgi:tetratricopeptide (TPR) repeat protein